MKDRLRESDAVRARSRVRPHVGVDEVVAGYFTARGRRRDGTVLWEERIKNLITNEGLDHRQDVVFLAGTQVAAWFILPVQAASTPASTLPTIAAADTMASHAGWVEVTAYDEATREAYTAAAGATGVVSNTASLAEFTINGADTDIGGVVLTSVSTKGATTGVCFAGKAFAAVRRLQPTDVLEVTYTQTSANA